MSMYATTPEAIYTTKELSEILKVSQRAVQWMIKQHQLKAVRIGNGYRVRQSAINDFFEKYETTPTGEHQ